MKKGQNCEHMKRRIKLKIYQNLYLTGGLALIRLDLRLLHPRYRSWNLSRPHKSTEESEQALLRGESEKREKGLGLESSSWAKRIGTATFSTYSLHGKNWYVSWWWALKMLDDLNQGCGMFGEQISVTYGNLQRIEGLDWYYFIARRYNCIGSHRNRRGGYYAFDRKVSFAMLLFY